MSILAGTTSTPNIRKPWSLPENGHSLHRICDYIVLAEFDIDTGSTVRHQYPSKIPNYPDDWFAENMLPEGAHNRQIDYTYMFLNRNGDIVSSNDYTASGSGLKTAQSDNIFLYGLNLCLTKHDSSVRRGAVVKAMSVFSRHSCVEILKRPLNLALEEYFRLPGEEVLEILFRALNAVDISKFPSPSPLEKLLMKRGTVFDPLGGHVSEHTPKAWNFDSQFRIQFSRKSEELAEHVDATVVEVPFRIPLYRTTDEVGDISVVTLVKIFGESTMRIFNAVLMKQRILFVGYNHAASDVCQMVLSSVALVTPALTNIIRRVFAYANFTDLSFLEVPGFIAGVTNPMFQEHDTWWDLLCVLDFPNNTGTVKSAEEKRAEDPKSKQGGSGGGSGSAHAAGGIEEGGLHTPFDARFIAGVISGIQAGIGELWVRQQFFDYTTAIVTQAQAMSVHSLSGSPQLPSRTPSITATSDDNAASVGSPGSASGAISPGGTGGVTTPGSTDKRFRLSRLSSGGKKSDYNAGLDYSRVTPRLRKRLEANSRRAGLLRDSGALQSVPLHPWVWANASVASPSPSPVDEAGGAKPAGGAGATSSHEYSSPSGSSSSSSSSTTSASTSLASEDGIDCGGGVRVASATHEVGGAGGGAGVAGGEAGDADRAIESDGDGHESGTASESGSSVTGTGSISAAPSVSGTDTPDSTASGSSVHSGTSPDSTASGSSAHSATSIQGTASLSSEGAQTASTDETSFSFDAAAGLEGASVAQIAGDDVSGGAGQAEGSEAISADTTEREDVSVAPIMETGTGNAVDSSITSHAAEETAVDISSVKVQLSGGASDAGSERGASGAYVAAVAGSLEELTVTLPAVGDDAVDGYTLKSYVLRLQSEVGLHPVQEAQPMYAHLDAALASEASVQALLTLLPEAQGGLHPIAAALFHPNPALRFSAVSILNKIQLYESTKPALGGLNGMLKAAYERQQNKLEDGSLRAEVDAHEEQLALAAAILAAQAAEAAFYAHDMDFPTPLAPPAAGRGLGAAASPPPPNLFRSPSDTTINALDMIP